MKPFGAPLRYNTAGLMVIFILSLLTSNTAKALGLSMPTLLYRADKVIR